MKKLSAVPLVALLAAAFLLTTGAPVAPPTAPTIPKVVKAKEQADPATWRLAVADWACLQAAGVTVDTLHEVCLWGKKVGPHIHCLTKRQQVHACEVDPAGLADEHFRRFVVCRHKDEFDQWQVTTRWAKLDATVPDGWVCKVIIPKAWWRRSMANVRGELEEALEAKCGFPVQPTSWKCCPSCMVWPEGCPSCMNGCKAGRDWKDYACLCEDDGCCGNGACEARIRESCSSCPADCGACPEPEPEPDPGP